MRATQRQLMRRTCLCALWTLRTPFPRAVSGTATSSRACQRSRARSLSWHAPGSTWGCCDLAEAMYAEALAVTCRLAGRLNDDKHALCRGVLWAVHGPLLTGRMHPPQKLHGLGNPRRVATISRQSSFHAPTLGTMGCWDMAQNRLHRVCCTCMTAADSRAVWPCRSILAS